MAAESKSNAGWAMASMMLIPLWPIFALWRGYAIATLWGWFIVPAFGAPALSIHFAIGLMLVIGALRDFRHSHDERETIEKFFTSLTIGIIGPALMLGIGWLWHWLQWGM